MLIQKLPFSRIVRDIAQKCAPFGPQLRFTGEALAALQCVTEETMTMIFEMTYTQTCISLNLGTKQQSMRSASRSRPKTCIWFVESSDEFTQRRHG